MAHVDRLDVSPPRRDRSLAWPWRRAVGALLLSMGLSLGVSGARRPPAHRATGAGAAGVRSAVQLGADGRPEVPASQRLAAAAAPAAAALRETARPLVIESAPGGGEMVRVDARLARDTVARRDRDGRLVLGCERPGGSADRAAE